MATEIRKPRIIGNFKPSMAEKAAAKREAAADRYNNRDGNDSAHLVLIRRLPCLATLAREGREIAPCDPHHLKCGPAAGERGMSRRASDRWALPLSRAAHEELERLGSRRELAWWNGLGIEEPWELANRLWRATGDQEQMYRIIKAFLRIE